MNVAQWRQFQLLLKALLATPVGDNGWSTQEEKSAFGSLLRSTMPTVADLGMRPQLQDIIRLFDPLDSEPVPAPVAAAARRIASFNPLVTHDSSATRRAPEQRPRHGHRVEKC